ncbi:class V chitinase CHIT5a-like [Corylus avellana]|uniref:class V chitinase CHIT5a-like n=1 Tax=Corylus avellana TaxID=13451 RepID=UPI00286D515B|nr:class V chitinase CHIT5a-like [Corylus avellana]
MGAQKNISLSLIILVILFHTNALKCIAFPHPSRGIKAAYWPSFDAFPASAIDTSYFTHIYYAFLLPDPNTYKLNVTPFHQTKIPGFIGAIRAKNPPVKTLLSTGGGGNDPTVFSKMVSSRATRQIFIDSTIEVARNYGFDGVDLDWEFPATAEDMSNLALLYKQWRKALLDEAKTCRKPPLLLTSAVYYSSKFTYGEPRSYPVEAIVRYVDWISPMCFDYHGSWENFTGIHSALRDIGNGNLSTHFGIGSWIEAGVLPSQLVMGLPLYGRTWKLRDPYVNGIGAPALGVGPGDGAFTYHQILDFNEENNATVVFDGQTASFYSYAGDYWIGYDDVQSVRLKILFARSRQLGGYFFWALGQDKGWTISSLGKALESPSFVKVCYFT